MFLCVKCVDLLAGRHCRRWAAHHSLVLRLRTRMSLRRWTQTLCTSLAVFRTPGDHLHQDGVSALRRSAESGRQGASIEIVTSPMHSLHDRSVPPAWELFADEFRWVGFMTSLPTWRDLVQVMRAVRMNSHSTAFAEVVGKVATA